MNSWLLLRRHVCALTGFLRFFHDFFDLGDGWWASHSRERHELNLVLGVYLESIVYINLLLGLRSAIFLGLSRSVSAESALVFLSDRALLSLAAGVLNVNGLRLRIL